MLGCSAAVMETLSPSQPNPAVIHTMWTSVTADDLPLELDAAIGTSLQCFARL